MNTRFRSLSRFLAALLVLIFMATAPWLVIAPHAYLPGSVQGALDLLLKALHTAPAPVPGVIDVFAALTSITALKLLATGFLNPWLWIVILLPMIVAGLALLGSLIGALLDFDGLNVLVEWISVLGGGLALVFLVASLPQIEHFGLGGNYLARVTLPMIGVQLAWGYWATLVGLLLLVGLGLYGLLRPGGSARPRKIASSRYGTRR